MEHFVSQIYIHAVYAFVSAVPIYLHLRLLAPWPILIPCWVKIRGPGR